MFLGSINSDISFILFYKLYKIFHSYSNDLICINLQIIIILDYERSEECIGFICTTVPENPRSAIHLIMFLVPNLFGHFSIFSIIFYCIRKNYKLWTDEHDGNIWYP